MFSVQDKTVREIALEKPLTTRVFEDFRSTTVATATYYSTTRVEMREPSPKT